MKSQKFWLMLSGALIVSASAFTGWETYRYVTAEQDLAVSVLATVKILVGVVLILSSLGLWGWAKGLKN